MKYLILLLTLSTAHAFSSKLPTPEQADAGTFMEVPGLTLEKQQKPYTCWAASTRILISQKTKPLPAECEIVGSVVGINCCTSNSTKCNMAQHFHSLPAKYNLHIDNTPTFNEAVALVRAGKPVAISHSTWAGTAQNTGHSEVAYGAYKVNGKDYLVVYDPLKNVKKYMDSSYVAGNLAWHQLVSVK